MRAEHFPKYGDGPGKSPAHFFCRSLFPKIKFDNPACAWYNHIIANFSRKAGGMKSGVEVIRNCSTDVSAKAAKQSTTRA
jgi:hypothetical protein